MPLSEADFTVIADAGCDTCGSKKLIVESLVAQKLTLLGGEPYGQPTWGYKGEELVQGTYRIACDGCKKDLYQSSVCPLCNAEGGVERALAQENGFPLPETCASCGHDMLTATAYVPATISYEGKRAQKARTTTKPEDAGFHAIRVDCKECRAVSQRKVPCPLCR
ncbi:MAG: hypothetical protein ABI461_13105 [Polyangiaceae bacterium]